MNIDRMVLAFAGFMILLSVVLAHFVSPYWLLLTVFVGANLLQSSFNTRSKASQEGNHVLHNRNPQIL